MAGQYSAKKLPIHQIQIKIISHWSGGRYSFLVKDAAERQMVLSTRLKYRRSIAIMWGDEILARSQCWCHIKEILYHSITKLLQAFGITIVINSIVPYA